MSVPPLLNITSYLKDHSTNNLTVLVKTIVTADDDFKSDYEQQYTSFKVQNPPHDTHQTLNLSNPDTNQHYHHSSAPSIFHHSFFFYLATLCFCSSLYRHYIENETSSILYTQRKVMSNASHSSLLEKIVSQRREDVSNDLVHVGKGGLLWKVLKE